MKRHDMDVQLAKREATLASTLLKRLQNPSQPFPQMALPLLSAPAPINGIATDDAPFLIGQRKGILHLAVVLQNIAAKVSGIVRVDAELDTLVKI